MCASVGVCAPPRNRTGHARAPRNGFYVIYRSLSAPGLWARRRDLPACRFCGCSPPPCPARQGMDRRAVRPDRRSHAAGPAGRQCAGLFASRCARGGAVVVADLLLAQHEQLQRCAGAFHRAADELCSAGWIAPDVPPPGCGDADRHRHRSGQRGRAELDRGGGRQQQLPEHSGTPDPLSSDEWYRNDADADQYRHHSPRRGVAGQPVCVRSGRRGIDRQFGIPAIYDEWRRLAVARPRGTAQRYAISGQHRDQHNHFPHRRWRPDRKCGRVYRQFAEPHIGDHHDARVRSAGRDAGDTVRLDHLEQDDRRDPDRRQRPVPLRDRIPERRDHLCVGTDERNRSRAVSGRGLLLDIRRAARASRSHGGGQHQCAGRLSCQLDLHQYQQWFDHEPAPRRGDEQLQFRHVAVRRFRRLRFYQHAAATPAVAHGDRRARPDFRHRSVHLGNPQSDGEYRAGKLYHDRNWNNGHARRHRPAGRDCR